ncbi:uncharacterized protein LOC144452946 isoform X2 [Glandiceps talaboti]
MATSILGGLASLFLIILTVASYTGSCTAQTVTSEVITSPFVSSRLFTVVTGTARAETTETDRITLIESTTPSTEKTTRPTTLLKSIIPSWSPITTTTYATTTEDLPTTSRASTSAYESTVEHETSTSAQSTTTILEPTTTTQTTTTITTVDLMTSQILTETDKPTTHTTTSTMTPFSTTMTPTSILTSSTTVANTETTIDITTTKSLTSTDSVTTQRPIQTDRLTTHSQPSSGPLTETTARETRTTATTPGKTKVPSTDEKTEARETTLNPTTEPQSATDPPGSDPNAVAIVLVTLGAVLVVVLAAFFAVRYYRRSGGGRNNDNMPERGLPKVQSFLRKSTERDGTIPRRNVGQRRSMQFNRRSLALGVIIGKGSYTQVMRGQAWKITEGKAISDVAIKMLKDDAREADRRRLLAELDTMRQLTIPPSSIISLLGYCVDEEPIYIIYEFAEHGTLQSYLREMPGKYYGTDTGVIVENKSKLTKTLLRFAEDIAEGMAYLHSNDVVHGDLSSLSIFVTEELSCKISDIGKQPKDRSSNTDIAMGRIIDLPLRWMSPETISHGESTNKSDVWAFGVVLWQLTTLGSTPYFTMASSQQVKGYVMGGGRLEKPEHCSQELYNLMSKCWLEDPKQRTSCKASYKKIQQFKENETEHLNMEAFELSLYGTIDEPMGREKC